MYRTAGVSAVSATTWCWSQTFSNIVCGARDIGECPGSTNRSGTRRGSAGHVDVVEPTPLVSRLTAKQSEESVHERFRHRAALAGPHVEPIDRANRGNLD